MCDEVACGLVAHFIICSDDVVVPSILAGHIARSVVVVLAVAATIDATNEDTIGISRRIQIFRSSRACSNASAPSVVDGVLFWMCFLCLTTLKDICQFRWKFVHACVGSTKCLSDRTGDVIAAIDGTDKNHTRTMFTIDIDECPTVNICHTCTAEDILNLAGADGYISVTTCFAFVATTINVTANGNLGRKVRCTEKQSPQEEQPPKRIGSIGHVWFVRYIRHIMVSLLTL